MLGNRTGVTFDYKSLLTTPKDLTGDYLKCLFYGKAGSGKTTLEGTFPNPLIFDTNKGLKTLQNNENVKVVSLEHTIVDENGRESDPMIYKTVMQILNDAKYKRGLFAEGEQLSDIKTIVIDDITNLSDFLKYGILKFVNHKDPTKDKADFDDWAMLSNQMSSIITLLKSLPYNIVVTAGEKVEMDELKGGQVGGVLLQGGYRHKISHEFDEVYHLVVKSAMGKTQYLCETVNVYPFNAKSRQGFNKPLEGATYDIIVKGTNK